MHNPPSKVRVDSLGTAGIIVTLAVAVAVVGLAAIDTVTQLLDYLTAALDTAQE